MKNYDYYYLAKRNLLQDASERNVLKGKLEKKSKIHISAVCGKAMASIACMLQQSSFDVSGSDVSFYPPMSEVLNVNNIKCLNHNIDNLKNIDLFIPGNMLPSNFPEVIYARENKIPMMSGAEVVGNLLTKNRRSLVVCGTHGKTTTSSLLVHVFQRLNKNPAYMIGGVFQNNGESFSLGKKESNFAIFEGDEYDCAFFDKAPKFLRYNPTSIIITSIEHDHIDLYPTLKDYIQAFQFLIDEIPENGFIVANESVFDYLDFSKCKGKIYKYGIGEDSYISYKIKNITEDGTFFDFRFGDIWYQNIFIPLFGEYNILNTISVFGLALLEGLDKDKIIEGLKTYPGVCERQEKIGVTKNNITIFRDFAHHPTAVSVTLDGFRSRYPNNRLIAIFHPRSITSRRKIFEKEYPRVLSSADVSIIISPPFKEVDSKNDFMDVSVIKSDLEDSNKEVFVVPEPKFVNDVLDNISEDNDVLVFMSNSNLENVPEDFLKKFS